MSATRASHVRWARLIVVAAALALAACAPPPGAGGPARERPSDAPPLALVPRALFEAPLEHARAGGAELAAGAEDLAARAAALRARAAALSDDPALDPEGRARLEAARPR